MSEPIRTISLDELIHQADAAIEQARQQEQLYLAEAARAQGTRAAHEEWRRMLLGLINPPAEPAPAEE